MICWLPLINAKVMECQGESCPMFTDRGKCLFSDYLNTHIKQQVINSQMTTIYSRIQEKLDEEDEY
jgi:hypothetical protein